MTIVGTGGVTGLELVTLLVMAVLVALDEIGTETLLLLLLTGTDSGPHIP